MSNIEKFCEWLNDEIKEIETHKGTNSMLWGSYSEAIRIRQMLCDMDAKDNTPDREELEEIAGKICKKYCKFPEAYGDREDDNQRMIEERCEKCPLNELVK